MNRLIGIGLLGLGLAGATTGATAAMVAGQGSAGAPVQRSLTAAPVVPATAATVELVGGVIEAVDATRLTLTLRGKPVALHDTRLQVLDAGGHSVGGVSSLRPGLRIRFALEPGQAPDRRIVLIYIDRQP
jgi:hypothetical protein